MALRKCLRAIVGTPEVVLSGRAVSDLTLEKLILKVPASGNCLSPARRRACIDTIIAKPLVSERTACKVLVTASLHATQDPKDP